MTVATGVSRHFILLKLGYNREFVNAFHMLWSSSTYCIGLTVTTRVMAPIGVIAPIGVTTRGDTGRGAIQTPREWLKKRSHPGAITGMVTVDIGEIH